MYFITPSKPGIFLIGIYRNRLYGFGENKSKKLCIYSKSIFDCGDWDEFFTIDIQVVRTECCETGLHVAAGIHETKIWVATRNKEVTRVYSIDIFSKELISYEMTDEFKERFPLLNLNLCCKCLMPIIHYIFAYQNGDCFLITPRQFQKDTETFQCIIVVNSSLRYSIFKKNAIQLRHDPSSCIAFNYGNAILSVFERSEEENGRIKTMLTNATNGFQTTDIPDDCVWHDITFFNDNYDNICAITRQQNIDNITLQLYRVEFTMDADLTFRTNASVTVNSNFPSFKSSPFFLSYHLTNCLCHPGKQIFKPDLIVLQTEDAIVTVPFRMLSLSETAFLTLQKIPEPPALPSDAVEHFVSKKKVKDPWMSLNYIKKTLKLSKNFDLV